MHEARASEAREVVIWGTGSPRREFLLSDDAAGACVFLMNLSNEKFDTILAGGCSLPTVNVGCGEDTTIRELAELIARVVGFKGTLVFDASKPDGTFRKLLDIDRLRNLGWNCSTPLEEGLITTYKDFLERQTPARGAALVSPQTQGK
jgi:GDP-L-fucose synthase